MSTKQYSIILFGKNSIHLIIPKTNQIISEKISSDLVVNLEISNVNKLNQAINSLYQKTEVKEKSILVIFDNDLVFSKYKNTIDITDFNKEAETFKNLIPIEKENLIVKSATKNTQIIYYATNKILVDQFVNILKNLGFEVIGILPNFIVSPNGNNIDLAAVNKIIQNRVQLLDLSLSSITPLSKQALPKLNPKISKLLAIIALLVVLPGSIFYITANVQKQTLQFPQAKTEIISSPILETISSPNISYRDKIKVKIIANADKFDKAGIIRNHMANLGFVDVETNYNSIPTDDNQILDLKIEFSPDINAPDRRAILSELSTIYTNLDAVESTESATNITIYSY